jgi:hypothetical protein
MGTAVDDFIPEISRGAKNCPYPTQVDALVRAARQFCNESWYVKRLLLITLTPNVSQYDLPLSSGDEEIIAISYASVTQINGGTLPMWAGAITNPNRAPQLPRQWAYIVPSRIAVFPLPDKAYPVQVEVIVQPIQSADEIPTEVFKKYQRTIGYGALAWIYGMREETFYDPREAARCAKAFEAGINNGKTEALRASLPGNQRVMPRRFLI